MTQNAAMEAADSSGRFHTTCWSLILSSLDGQSDEVRIFKVIVLCHDPSR